MTTLQVGSLAACSPQLESFESFTLTGLKFRELEVPLGWGEGDEGWKGNRKRESFLHFCSIFCLSRILRT